MRCIVVGESNISVEASHELGMKCLIPTGHKPVYDFVGADLVVRHVGQVAFLNLKKLFGQETLVKPRMLEQADEFRAAPLDEGGDDDDDNDFLMGLDDAEEDEDEINAPFSRSRGVLM